MVADLYAVLGVPRGATAAELKAAYRRGVLASHPDRHRLSPPAERARAEARFRALTEAHETLTNARARSSYDRAGPGGAAGAGASAAAPPLPALCNTTCDMIYPRSIDWTTLESGT